MNSYQLVLFTIFFVIAGMMVIDKNLGEYFLLKLQLAGMNLRRWYLMAKLHPRNPLTNYVMYRKMKELAKHMEQNNGKD